MTKHIDDGERRTRERLSEEDLSLARMRRAVREESREVITDEFDKRAGLRGVVHKNGHTWTQYLMAQIDLKLIGIIIGLVFTVGGNYREAQQQIASAVKTAAEASDQMSKASKRVQDVSDQVTAVADQQARTNDEQQRLAKEVKALHDQLLMAVTRPEFRTTAQQLIVRLERIEKRIEATR